MSPYSPPPPAFQHSPRRSRPHSHGGALPFPLAPLPFSSPLPFPLAPSSQGVLGLAWSHHDPSLLLSTPLPFPLAPSSQGVLGLAWSHHDPSLLLSSAKDNRTIVWDVNSAEQLAELPVSANWSFDVQVGWRSWCQLGRLGQLRSVGVVEAVLTVMPVVGGKHTAFPLLSAPNPSPSHPPLLPVEPYHPGRLLDLLL